MTQLKFIDGDELAGKIHCIKFDINRARNNIKKAEITGEKRVFVDVNDPELNDCNALTWVLNLIDNYLSDYENEKDLEVKP